MTFDASSWTSWLWLIIILFLVLLDGLVAGLVLGLLSLDETKLKVLATSGSPAEKRAAGRIAPVRRRGHLLLVSLLLTNTIINATLPILLDSIVGTGWLAVLITTALVVIFAEIIPQSVCHRFGLTIGSYFIWFVWLDMIVMFIFAYPIAKILDYFLGTHEGALYKRMELKEFVGLHGQPQGGELSKDEVSILQGTLQLHSKRISDIMTPLSRTFMLDVESFLDDTLMQRIAQSGHSRIPIFSGDRDNIVGIMLVKNLILLDDRVPTYIRDLILNKAPRMNTMINLFDALNVFQEGASHMSIVVDDNDKVLGVCTLEDIIEDIVNHEIIDETDVFVDNTQAMKVIRKPRSERKQIVKAANC